MSTGLVVVGAAGRLGRAVLDCAESDPDLIVAAAVVRSSPENDLPGNPPVHSDFEAAVGLPGAEVVLDVALGEGLTDRVQRVAEAGMPLVVGVTGLDGTMRSALHLASERIPILVAPNFSPGLTLLVRALRTLLAPRDLDWEGSILDRHHAGKRDAPSGTARWLAAVLAAEGVDAQVRSEREGEVIGEHTVRLVTGEEELTLSHRALDRRLFAQGALRAVRWIVGSTPGHYTMEDVLAGASGSPR